jgi:hypothetical protein
MTGIKKLRKSELIRRTIIKVRRLTSMTQKEMKLRISPTNRLPNRIYMKTLSPNENMCSVLVKSGISIYLVF